MATLIYHNPLVDDAMHRLYQEPMSEDPRKAEQPAPFRGEFSFVNKDAGNIDSKDHNAAVSWHVMNRYERWKKQDQAKKLRASANVPVGPLSPPLQQQYQQHQRSRGTQQQQPRPVGAPQRQRSTAQQRRPSPQRRPSQSVRPVPSDFPNTGTPLTDSLQTLATSSASPFGFDPWMVEQPLQVGYPGISAGQGSHSGLQTSSSSTPSTQSGIFDEDPSVLLGSLSTSLEPENPFEAPSLSMTPLVGNLMGFAYEVFIPQLWPKESNRSQGAYEIARSWDDVALINQDTCYANAYMSLLVAAMAALMEDESLAYQSRYFQGQAMTELRQRVAQQSPPDLITLKAILKLFSSETMGDNTSVARMHLKMIRNLINAAGGVILMDAWFREDLLSCDCYFALKYETRPLFPAQEWTPGPLSQPWKARLLSAGISGDHAAGVDALVEHPVTKTVVTDLRELFKTWEYIQDHEVPADDQLLRWQQLRKFDCISRLADHHVNLAIYPHLFQRPITQAYGCVATALMTNMVLGSPEPVRFGIKLIGDLRQKLRESEAEGESAPYRRLRLWALYVGSLAEKVHPVDIHNDAWFDSSYRAQAADMGLSRWDDAKKVMRQFLYSDLLHREIESGRPYRTADAKQGLYSASGCSWREPVLDTNLVGDPEESGGGSGPESMAGSR